MAISEETAGGSARPDPANGGYREHYIRDAQGNIMATYRFNPASLVLNDRPLYGSSRLGNYTKDLQLHNYLPGGQPPLAIQQGELNYELTDHLGNVSAVVTGNLITNLPGVTPCQAQLVSAQGYEGFGALLPGRNYNSASYRMGFNGTEKDDEIHGATGTAYTTFFRENDTRLGRWWSLDPKAVQMPWLSPYMSMDGNPIRFMDPLGDKVKYDRAEGVSRKEFREMKRNIRDMRRNSGSYNEMFTSMKNDDRTFTFQATSSATHGDASPGFDASGNLTMEIGIGGDFNARVSLIAHETGHGYRGLLGATVSDPSIPIQYMDKQYFSPESKAYVEQRVANHRGEEIATSHIENIVRSELINSGSSRFADLGLSTFYTSMLRVEKSDYVFGKGVAYTFGVELFSLVRPPRSAEYYMKGQFEISKEAVAKPPFLWK